MLKSISSHSRYYGSFMNIDLARIYLGRTKEAWPNLSHMKAAVSWICRAQDAFGDGGVARSYSLVYNPFFRRKGWTPSYPETTGYIIPTLFKYASLAGDSALFSRAVRMAEWESRVQLENGAVRGGTIDSPPSPAIFNTGQVIFGWLAAYNETGREQFLLSAEKAGEYLVREQDADGAWRKNLSRFATDKIVTYVYNTRTAWALAKLYSADNEIKFLDAAVSNIEFALGQQNSNGWFRYNCLYRPEEPLTHTIAYAIRGILETGLLLREERYIKAAKKAADALLKRQRSDGSLPGTFNEKWESTSTWSCLTGNAQAGIIWGRLYQVTGDRGYLNGLKRINEYLKRVQLLDAKNPDVFGGICGSYPIHGSYGRFEILNWAVKFFIDSLMTENEIADHSMSPASRAF